MSRFHLWLAIGVAAVQIATAGCAFGRKTYASDPLIKKNRAVWGNAEKAAKGDDSAGPEPIVPPPPNQPPIGGQID